MIEDYEGSVERVEELREINEVKAEQRTEDEMHAWYVAMRQLRELREVMLNFGFRVLVLRIEEDVQVTRARREGAKAFMKGE